MKWILIVFLSTNWNPVHLTHIEFDDRQACEATRQTLKDKWERRGVEALCTPKETPKS